MIPGKKRSKLRQVIRKTATERFVEKIEVDKITGCWTWKGSYFGSNKNYQYGQFIGAWGEHVSAHIFAYERFVGPVPEGMKCCHRCDNTKCVNPYHIFLASQAGNVQDARQKGRMPSWKDRGLECPAIIGMKNGKANPHTKLTESKVREMRKLWDNGFSLTVIRKKYSVDTKTAESAITGKTWKHVR